VPVPPAIEAEAPDGQRAGGVTFANRRADLRNGRVAFAWRHSRRTSSRGCPLPRGDACAQTAPGHRLNPVASGGSEWIRALRRADLHLSLAIGGRFPAVQRFYRAAPLGDAGGFRAVGADRGNAAVDLQLGLWRTGRLGMALSPLGPAPRPGRPAMRREKMQEIYKARSAHRRPDHLLTLR
jgi:hypothetical protein